MNKKYFIHFTWIVTLIMLIFTGLCLVDGVSIFVPFFHIYYSYDIVCPSNVIYWK